MFTILRLKRNIKSLVTFIIVTRVKFVHCDKVEEYDNSVIELFKGMCFKANYLEVVEILKSSSLDDIENKLEKIIKANLKIKYHLWQMPNAA